MSDDERAKKYPGIESSQFVVLPSYQWMVARLESADSRIQAVITFIATMTFAIPAFGRSWKETISFGSIWFVMALAVASVAFLLGIWRRSAGQLWLLHPSTLYTKWRSKNEWEFQRDLLYWAGQHFEANSELVRKKALVLNIVTSAFVLELALLAVWIATTS